MVRSRGASKFNQYIFDWGCRVVGGFRFGLQLRGTATSLIRIPQFRGFLVCELCDGSVASDQIYYIIRII